MIAETRTAWRRNLASMGSPKISSNTPWKNTTKMKKIVLEATEDRARPFGSDIPRNLRIPAMEGKRCVSDIVNPSVLALRDRDIPSNLIVDCLVVRKRVEAHAKLELSLRINEATSVCATVGGIRYSLYQPTNSTGETNP